MGLFTGNIQETAVISEQGMQQLEETYLYEYILKNYSETEIKQFCESKEAEALVEAGKMSKKTIVRLSKNDDLARRKKMAAYQLAKDNNDSLWNQLVKNRIKERELIEKIELKYNNKAEQLAKLGQKDYLKGHNPLAFMRPDGSTMGNAR